MIILIATTGFLREADPKRVRGRIPDVFEDRRGAPVSKARKWSRMGAGPVQIHLPGTRSAACHESAGRVQRGRWGLAEVVGAKEVAEADRERGEAITGHNWPVAEGPD